MFRHARQLPGSRLTVDCPPHADADTVKDLAFEKQSNFNKHIISALSTDPQSYKLIYKSLEETIFIPGTSERFMLHAYKEAIGLPYQSLLFGLLYGRFWNRHA